MSTVDKYYDKYFLNINSLGRVNPTMTSTTDFRVQLGYPIKGYVARMRLLSCTMPNVMNVFNSTNNVLQFIDSGGANSITIPDGTYTLTELMTLLKTLLDAASPDTYTITFNSNTLQLTITSTSALFQIDTTNLSNSAFYQLGAAPDVISAPSAQQVFPNAVELSGIKKAYIRLNNFVFDLHNVNTGVFTFAVNITSCYSEINYFFHRTHTNQEYYFETDSGRKYNVSSIDVQLTDEFSRPLDLKGKNWECLIEFDLDPMK